MMRPWEQPPVGAKIQEGLIPNSDWSAQYYNHVINQYNQGKSKRLSKILIFSQKNKVKF